MEINPFIYHNIQLLLIALVLDLLIGDPVYKFHPVRLLGNFLSILEKWIFQFGLNNKFGGVLLFVILIVLVFGFYLGFHSIINSIHPMLGWLFEIYIVFHLVALKDLLVHAKRIVLSTEEGDLEKARYHTSMLAGRDKDKMDLKACNRCAVESVSESLVDGVISPLFYLLIFGVYGMLLFKIVSTMDSMIGYKNKRYINFGWFGAKLDDVMNILPARMTWLLMTFVSFLIPGFSGRNCFLIGLNQHALVPGPNAGWSECAAAGSLGIKIAGPIFKDGVKVNDLWLGDPESPEGGSSADVYRVIKLITITTFIFAVLAINMGILVNILAV